MKKFILLFVFALSLAIVGTAQTQAPAKAPAKKAPAKTEVAPAKTEVVPAAKPAEVKKDKKMNMKKVAPAKKPAATPEKK